MWPQEDMPYQIYMTRSEHLFVFWIKKTCNSLSISPALLTRARGQFPNDGDGEDSFHNKPISYLSAQQRGEILHDIGEGREETVLKIISKISD